jgi:hypothetical protein
MAHQAGTPQWDVGQTAEKPRLTQEVVTQKAKRIAERYQDLLLGLSAAAMELGNEGDPLGLQLLTSACEDALSIGVEACANALGADE